MSIVAAVVKFSFTENRKPEKKRPPDGGQELLVGGGLSLDYLKPLPGKGPAVMYPFTISMFILISGSRS